MTKGRQIVVSILAAGGMSSEAIVRWLLAKNRLLQGRTPFVVLEEDRDDEAVIAAARRCFEP